MTFEHVLSLLAGLALFLYGMHMMSVGLEEAAGDRMKGILEKLTSNRFIGILVGAAITAVIQSSSATTVMVVGFVNSGLMTLRQAVWIIMGANIGTTITGQLVALNVDQLAPIMAICGVIMITFINIKKVNSFGEVIAGFGILFIGMSMMSDAMYPLRDSPAFIHLITTISNPFVAVLIGAGFTAIIQSSSASVGILQTLAKSGLIPLSSSIYIIFGQNIGTCITAILASLNANRNAKRTTIIHLFFNIIGTLMFMSLIQILPFVEWMEMITSNQAAQIANSHTIFNLATTLLLLPFGGQLAELSEKIMPITESELFAEKSVIPLNFVDINNIGSVPIAISSMKKEAKMMLELSQKNLFEAIDSLSVSMPLAQTRVKQREDSINYMNHEMADYMSKVSLLNMNQQESDTCNSIYQCFSDIERIGDHAMNIVDHSLTEKNRIKKPELVKNELLQLKNLIKTDYAIILSEEISETDFNKIEEIEDQMDVWTAKYRQNQINRLKEGLVDASDCVIYSQIMTDLERVSDHMMNISQQLQKNQLTFTNES